MKINIYIILIVILSLFISACGNDAKNEMEKYRYNLTYGLFCGRKVNIELIIDGKVKRAMWDDIYLTVPVYNSMAEIGDLIGDKLIKGLDQEEAMDVAKANIIGEKRAREKMTEDIELKECKKSAKYIYEYHSRYGFNKSAKLWKALYDYLDKFSSWKDVIKNN